MPARAAWWALLGLAIGEVAGGVIGALAGAVTGAGSTSALVVLAGELGLWAGMLGACIFVARRYGTGSLRRDFGARFRPADLGWGPLVTVAGLVATAVLSHAFVGTRLSGSNTQLIDGQTHNTAGFAVIAVIVSVGAPIFEELFFRGLVRAALSSRLGPIGAVFAQAGLFGLAHLNPTSGLGNVEVVVVIGAFGVLLGLAAQLTGRLAAGMIGHGLYNLLVTVAILTR
ncbi:CPBP family intramembrane glutamic endopeptidase [Acidiferrimicrobium sp. IK]|uniref:CPBP family intramembrane glutamic endopeptidase n=1 Tax=Acidiferrimicrobium sp. IK TaxID=2871700 RepID=UPI0021CB588D|nr:CPBP family glutamic-type intramembrane protease [Acidiferrimicrobium sp. IK]